jgi:hypothetical protein
MRKVLQRLLTKKGRACILPAVPHHHRHLMPSRDGRVGRSIIPDHAKHASSPSSPVDTGGVHGRQVGYRFSVSTSSLMFQPTLSMLHCR